MTEEPDPYASADRGLRALAEGVVPIVAEYISNEWDWRPWLSEPPIVGEGATGPTVRPPGQISVDAWTVVFEGAYPWAIDFIASTHEAGRARDYIEANSLFADCQTGYAIYILRG